MNALTGKCSIAPAVILESRNMLWLSWEFGIWNQTSGFKSQFYHLPQGWYKN